MAANTGTEWVALKDIARDAARITEQQKRQQPEWLWFDTRYRSRLTFGRYSTDSGEVPYLRGDLAVALANSSAGKSESPPDDSDVEPLNLGRMQARYDQLARDGKHGHYETMFQVWQEEYDRLRASKSAPVTHQFRRVMVYDPVDAKFVNKSFNALQTRDIFYEVADDGQVLSGIFEAVADPVDGKIRAQARELLVVPHIVTQEISGLTVDT